MHIWIHDKLLIYFKLQIMTYNQLNIDSILCIFISLVFH